MNSTKTIGIIALLVIALSLFASVVSAELIINKYTNDFSLSSPNNEQLKLCSCETKVDRLVVENVGSFYGDFHVAVESHYPGIRVAEPDFSLAPGRFKEVLVYIEDSCGKLGQYDYTVTVTNSYGRLQRLSRSIRVDVCQTSALTVSPDSLTVGLCQPGTYDVTITNVGTFADSFTLDFGSYNDIAKLNQKALYLNAGQSYRQNVSFQFACNDYGTKDIPFVMLTAKNGPGAMTNRKFTVTNQYNYELSLPTSVNVCAKTTTEITLGVKNNADAPDKVSFAFNAPPFVSAPQGVDLGPLESKNLTLTAKPQTAGSYAIAIQSMDAYGGVQRNRELVLNVNNCYAPAAEMRDSPTNVVTAPIQACCGPKTFYVNVRNDGDRAQAFELRVDGPSIFTLDETTVSVEPGQNLNVPLRATLPCSDQRYDVNVVVWPVGQPQVNATARLTIDSQTQRTCHMVQIDDDELAVKNDMTVVPVIVKQTGSAGGNYTITTNSSLFGFQETGISLQPGDQKAIHLVPKANLSAQERGRYIVQPTFTLTEQNIPYNEQIGVQLRGKNLWERFTEWLASIDLSVIGICAWVVFIALLVLLLALVYLLLIYAGKRVLFAEGLHRGTLSIIKTMLLVLIAIFLVLLVFLQAPGADLRYERVANTTNSTALEWYQNEQHTVDVSQYFTDPDKDTLSYTVTQPRDISAKINNRILTLTPDYNFAGENTMVITADDHKGGITDSPVFILRVIPRKHLSFLAWVENWCAYIFIIELVLLLLLLFLMVLTVKEYRPRPYKDNVLVVVERKQETRKPAGKSVRKSRLTRRSARTTSRSRALVPIPVKSATITRGRVTQGRALPSKGVALREYKGSGQTVNIAVGQPQANAPTVVTVPGYKPAEIVYVGAKGGNTVHTPYCMNARRIPRNKRVAFTTKKEAVNAGLVPCRMCRPFEGGI